jgi:hypothetical protein
MSDEPGPRSARFGMILTVVAVGGSFVGVTGWYLLTNRKGPAIDASGFDLNSTPKTQTVVPTLSAADSGAAPAASGLNMLRADAGIRVAQVGEAASSGSSGAPGSAGTSGAGAAAAGTPKEQAHQDFTTEARKNEATVRRFAEKMTAKYPVIRQYGRDWMSHPDLKKLNDDYMRNHDPIAFMIGLSRAPSLGGMVKKYAGKPEIREFIVDGMKEAPGELTTSALEVLQKDGVVKNLVTNVVSGMGLPSSITAMIGGGLSGDPSKMDQKQMLGGVMNDPEVQKAMQQQGQQAPPVNLGQ